jgi:hypothetical protein
MASPKFKVTVDQPAWLRMIREKQRPVATAAVAALRETAANAVQEGRQQIAVSGRFTRGWVSGLQYRTKDATVAGEPSLQAQATIFHTIGLAGVFEEGISITGNPLLWIPMRRELRNVPPRRAKIKLTSATVRGRPMLFDASDKDRHRTPLYIGVPAIRIPKKWHIIEIVKKHAAKLGFLFLKHFKDN